MVKYNFNFLLDRMISKHELVNGNKKVFANGLRYYKRLEPLVHYLELDEKPTHMAYISLN